MCLDLAKFCHFGNNFLVFGHFNKLYLVFGNILNLLWQMFNAIGQIFIVVNGQKNQSKYSHLVTMVGTNAWSLGRDTGRA